MMFDYDDEFLLIKQFQPTKLYIGWLSNCQSMSRLEFKNAIDIVLNTVTATQATKVLIDAFDFNYPVVSEETIRFIRYALLNRSSVKYYGLVNSHCLYGMITVELILQQIADIRINLVRFDERNEGRTWLLKE